VLNKPLMLRLDAISKGIKQLCQLAGQLIYFMKRHIMPWYNGDFPPSYKNQPLKLRNKAVEIANELLLSGTPEGIAIATGLKKAREFFAKKKKETGGREPGV
jgi:hypothetical protein